MGSIIGLIILALNIYSVIILARVLLTWLPNVDRNNAGVRFLHDATEPVLRPIREMLPQNSGIDFSPLVVMLTLSLVTMLLRML